ncbi:uncharacterized protein K02A2.6-like [Daphnia carinata]|uniref:uncharacterized protein K02A2.6-like n=1 Tax=Daphnia carinata TaxID=120202 RepID=UPI00257FE341|nr:uncharacterized protein K02A2.6-like [Daphnia carinata]
MCPEVKVVRVRLIQLQTKNQQGVEQPLCKYDGLRIPFHLRKKVEDELERLERLDVIEKVSGPTPWVSPVVIVPKKENGEIRLCVGMRLPNKAIMRERHLIPLMEDILADINGSKFFTVLDLKQAYHQLELDEDSRYITTISTHVGVFNVSDDILIHAPTEQEHDNRYAEVIKRLESKQLTINGKKKKLKQSRVKFFALVIGAEGAEVDQQKVSAIENFTRPQSVSEGKSCIGMASYRSRFIKNHADFTEPLRRLTTNEAKTQFVWNEQYENTFQKLKQALGNTRKLAFFDPELKMELIVDASPKGLDGILAQVNNKGERQIIAYASKALDATEKRYSQIEREALAIIWGCDHFQIYLLGSHFTVVTDHKPLVSIFNNPTSALSARLERWVLRRQPFEFTVAYKPGADNAADSLSRHPKNTCLCKQAEVGKEFVRFVSCQALPVALSAAEISKETSKNMDFQLIKKSIITGKWYPLTSDLMKAYHKIRQELTVSENGVILRGTRICVPPSLQKQVLNQAHDGHMGMNKTKALLRTRLWFPRMDEAVAKMVQNCLPCQAATLTPPKRHPIKMSPLPDYPWQQLSLEFSSLPSGEELMILIDDYSRFPEIEIVPSTASHHVIPKLDKLLSSFGIPEVIRTDNSPPFNGKEFYNFSLQLGFKHRKITPRWPEANGLVERFMKTVAKVIRTAEIECKDWRRELYRFLRNNRATPHPALKKSPYSILMEREPRTLLPDGRRV